MEIKIHSGQIGQGHGRTQFVAVGPIEGRIDPDWLQHHWWAIEQGLKELRMTVKTIRCIRSGFLDLDVRTDDGWVEVGADDPLPDRPYYVCALFRNGRHVPLPIITGDSGSWLQRAAAAVAMKIWGEQAKKACLAYVELWEQVYGQ